VILYVVLGLVALQRALELLYSAQNTRRLRARGGIEHGAVQYPFFIILHTAWLASMAIFIPAATVPNWKLLVLYALLQPFRIWTLASLGPYWTTRVITVAGAPRVRRGPYRIFRHPNYVIVCAEIAILPLAFGALEIAILFSFFNAALLSWRIRVEERALITASARTGRAAEDSRSERRESCSPDRS
jgi:methyltransferase